MSPSAQHPGAKSSEQEVPVDWRARSQVLEEALREVYAEWRAEYDGEVASHRLAVAFRKKIVPLLSLGLPDEEGEQDDSGYEARSAHPGDCVPDSECGL